ncbi:Maf family protein, partial [Salmonella enterica subsp. enterica serovar Montevideo]|nr:Maf family protein [Salmonella enterica subsp. enterica serovar Montevideo]
MTSANSRKKKPAQGWLLDILRNAQASSSVRLCDSMVPRDLPVLGADTIVVLNGEVLEKPRDAAHAAEMLRLLSGNT